METSASTKTSSIAKVAVVAAGLIVIGAAAYGFGLVRRSESSPVWYLTYGHYNQETKSYGYGYNPTAPLCNVGYGYNAPGSMVYSSSYGYGGTYDLTPVCNPIVVERVISKMVMMPSAIVLNKMQPTTFKVTLYDEYGSEVSGNYPIVWKVGGMADVYFGESSQVINYLAGSKRGQYHITAQYITLEGKKLNAYAKVTIK